jgi:hypothetical protein
MMLAVTASVAHRCSVYDWYRLGTERPSVNSEKAGLVASAGWIRTYDQPVSSVMMPFLQMQRSHP